jgi:hypothetical protein
MKWPQKNTARPAATKRNHGFQHDPPQSETFNQECHGQRRERKDAGMAQRRQLRHDFLRLCAAGVFAIPALPGQHLLFEEQTGFSSVKSDGTTSGSAPEVRVKSVVANLSENG